MDLKKQREAEEVIRPGEALKRFDAWVMSLDMKTARKAKAAYEKARETLLIKDAITEVYKVFGVKS